MIAIRVEAWERETEDWIAFIAETYEQAVNPLRPRDLTVQAVKWVSGEPRRTPPPKFFSHDHRRLTDVGDGLVYDDGTYYVRRKSKQ